MGVCDAIYERWLRPRFVLHYTRQNFDSVIFVLHIWFAEWNSVGNLLLCDSKCL